jgi:hypothetical protein
VAGLTLLYQSEKVDYAACARPIFWNFAQLMMPIVDRRMDKLRKRKHRVHCMAYIA